MLRQLRDGVKRIPVLGPALYKAYLVAFFEEGKVETIRGGTLEGWKFRRFMHTFWPEYVEGNYEPEIQNAFIGLIRPGQVVYDVGANVGFMTLLAAKLVGPTGSVVAFEPGETTAKNLRAQLEVNHLDYVTVEECAVSDKVGTCEFVVDDQSVTAHLGVVDGHSVGKKLRTLTVKTTTLDHMITVHKPPHFVKIDIEGAELLALAGAARLLAEIRPILAIELHSEDLSRDFHALMETSRYEVSLIDGTKAEAKDYNRFVVAKPLPV